MAAGGPGDHPLTDVLKYHLEVYGKTCDSLIIEIAKFVSFYELSEMFEWFDIHPDSQSDIDIFETQLKEKLQYLREKAKKDGWDL
jgi:hypothetical protein